MRKRSFPRKKRVEAQQIELGQLRQNFSLDRLRALVTPSHRKRSLVGQNSESALNKIVSSPRVLKQMFFLPKILQKDASFYKMSEKLTTLKTPNNQF